MSRITDCWEWEYYSASIDHSSNNNHAEVKFSYKPSLNEKRLNEKSLCELTIKDDDGVASITIASLALRNEFNESDTEKIKISDEKKIIIKKANERYKRFKEPDLLKIKGDIENTTSLVKKFEEEKDERRVEAFSKRLEEYKNERKTLEENIKKIEDVTRNLEKKNKITKEDLNKLLSFAGSNIKKHGYERANSCKGGNYAHVNLEDLLNIKNFDSKRRENWEVDPPEVSDSLKCRLNVKNWVDSDYSSRSSTSKSNSTNKN